MYENFKSTSNEDGTARTIALGISGKEPDELCVSVATSKDVWVLGELFAKMGDGKSGPTGRKGWTSLQSIN